MNVVKADIILAIVYGTLYMLFAAFPIVYQVRNILRVLGREKL